VTRWPWLGRRRRRALLVAALGACVACRAEGDAAPVETPPVASSVASSVAPSDAQPSSKPPVDEVYGPSPLNVAWSPRGTALAVWRSPPRAGNAPCEIAIHDARSGERRSTHTTPCESGCSTCARDYVRVAWTADESRFVVADWSTLRIYRTADAGLVVSTGSSAMFGMFDLAPDGEHLIWITEGGSGALVKTLDGREIRAFASASPTPRSFAWSSSRKLVVSSGDSSWSQSLPPVEVWDGRTGEPLRAFEARMEGPRWVAGTERFLAVTDRGWQIIDAADGHASSLPGAKGWLIDVTPTDDGGVVGLVGRSVVVWRRQLRTSHAVDLDVDADRLHGTSASGRFVAAFGKAGLALVDLEAKVSGGAATARTLHLREGSFDVLGWSGEYFFLRVGGNTTRLSPTGQRDVTIPRDALAGLVPSPDGERLAVTTPDAVSLLTSGGRFVRTIAAPPEHHGAPRQGTIEAR